MKGLHFGSSLDCCVIVLLSHPPTPKVSYQLLLLPIFMTCSLSSSFSHRISACLSTSLGVVRRLYLKSIRWFGGSFQEHLLPAPSRAFLRFCGSRMSIRFKTHKEGENMSPIFRFLECFCVLRCCILVLLYFCVGM